MEYEYNEMCYNNNFQRHKIKVNNYLHSNNASLAYPLKVTHFFQLGLLSIHSQSHSTVVLPVLQLVALDSLG